VHSYDLVDGTNKAPVAGKTTLMTNNVQNQLGMHDILRIVDEHCL